MEDIHIFGEKDYLIADEMSVGATLKVIVLEYTGRHVYADRLAPYYIVQKEDGTKKLFRLSITNEQLLARNGIKSYADLVGKVLMLTVRHFSLGHNGFVITSVGNAEQATQPQAPSQSPEPTVDTSPPATEKQIRMISGLTKSDEAKEIIKQFLDDIGKSDITQLTKPQASKLIDELLGNNEQATL